MNETERLIAALVGLNEAALAFQAGQIGIRVRNAAMSEADHAGATAQQIATCVGLGTKRVWQILADYGRSVPEDGHETP